MSSSYLLQNDGVDHSVKMPKGQLDMRPVRLVPAGQNHPLNGGSGVPHPAPTGTGNTNAAPGNTLSQYPTFFPCMVKCVGDRIPTLPWRYRGSSQDSQSESCACVLSIAGRIMDSLQRVVSIRCAMSTSTRLYARYQVWKTSRDARELVE
jgi:hypothetical protein